MKEYAIYVPGQVDSGDALAQVRNALPPAASLAQCAFFSNASVAMRLSNEPGAYAHYLMPLGPGYRKAIVLDRFPALYDNDFTLCWLAMTTLSLAPSGETWIGISNEQSNANRNRLTEARLRAALPSAMIDRPEGGWVRLVNGPGLAADIASLRTIYASCHDAFPAFAEAFRDASRISASEVPITEEDIERAYIYGLFGANQKSLAIESILEDHGYSSPVDGIDMGGGYGFMAAELAAKGHRMTVVDSDAGRIDVVGRWLIGLRDWDTVPRLVVDDMQNLPRYDGAFDLVSFMGSLLMIPRRSLPNVLRGTMRLLRPGGVLVVHENPRESGQPGQPLYDEMFPADELDAQLRTHAGTPRIYSPFTGKPVDWEQLKRRVFIAVVQKET